MTKIINLTPHPVKVAGMAFPKAEAPARVQQNLKQFDDWDNIEGCSPAFNIPIFQSTYGVTENLPERERNIFYIVSSIVATANPTRQDLLISCNYVRDKDGNIIEALGFIMNGI